MAKKCVFSWVTDFKFTCEYLFQIMRTERAQWRNENETTNTFKKQGYNLGDGYGIVNTRKREMTKTEEIKLRKNLNTDALFRTMRTGFADIHDHRSGTVTHTLADSLMVGFAMFSIKDPSLLAFDERRSTGPHNLMTIYGMATIPCDTSMREILDGVNPNDLRPLFKDAFRQLQRGKVMEKFVFMEDCYLLNLDGTGYFSSDSIHSEACLEKRNKKTGKVTNYLKTVGAAVVHTQDVDDLIIIQNGSLFYYVYNSKKIKLKQVLIWFRFCLATLKYRCPRFMPPTVPKMITIFSNRNSPFFSCSEPILRL